MDLLTEAVAGATDMKLHPAAELSLTVRTLEEANTLARRLREEPLVEYCSVREEGRETESAEPGRPVSCRPILRSRDADNTNRAAKTGG